MSTLDNLAQPWELERDLKNEPDINRKIDQVADAVGKLLDEMKTGKSHQKVLRLKENPFDRELVFQSLFNLYENLFSVAKRVLEKIGEFGSLEKIQLGYSSAFEVIEEAVNKMILSHERDEFLAPVSAKLEIKKGDYGPAMYSEHVKRVGRNLISSINSQINELFPTVSKICQGFVGVSNKFVSKETRTKSEREKYEEVWLIYQAEKAAMERIAEITAITKDKISFFQDLLDDFSKIKTAYREKTDSLSYLKEKSKNALDQLVSQGEETTDKLDLEKQLVSLDEKTAKLNMGIKKLREMERLLLTLNNLIEKFPGIENQIEFFIESDFQAKSVYKFLEEINQEMKGVFGQQNIQAFEVIGALVYKLKSTSLMYEDANYYQAVTRMANDVERFLQRTFGEKREKNIAQKVAVELQKSGLEYGVQNIHQNMSRIKELNNKIHRVLLASGDQCTDRQKDGKIPENPQNTQDELKGKLEKYLATVKKLSEEVFSQYQNCQKKFQDFIEKNIEEKHIGEQVLRAFVELSGRGETVPMKKEELVNFQKFKLYTKMLPDSRVQLFFAEALKKFMRGEPCVEIFPTNIRLRFVSEITKIEEIEHNYPGNPFKESQSKHGTAISFIAENISPKEIESLARFVPCMPRNELRLTYPPGKIFIEIAEKHMEFIRKQSLRQFVLVNPGEERKNENEIVFKQLAGKELIKKSYSILYKHLEPVFSRISEEKNREEDYINRERQKWQKELNQIILHLQYQIDALSSENLAEEGKFRVFTPEESALMAKYISPDQFDKIESLFRRNYVVDRDSVLAEVEIFLVRIIQDFYQFLEKDELMKTVFEETQEEKKKMHLGGKTENINRKIKEIEAIVQQQKIDQLLSFWGYGINKILPKSEQAPKQEADQIHYSQQDLARMGISIFPDQMHRIKENFGLIRNYANEKQRTILMGRGEALIKIAQACYDILEKDEAVVLPQEEVCRERMAEFKGDDTFRDEIDRLLSSKPASSQRSAEMGDRKSSGGKSSTETAVVRNIDKLITVYKEGHSGNSAPSDLPKVSKTNLKAYTRFISKKQIREIAAIAMQRSEAGSVNSAEKPLLIIAFNHLKERPDTVSKEEHKLIVSRYRHIFFDKP